MKYREKVSRGGYNRLFLLAIILGTILLRVNGIGFGLPDYTQTDEHLFIEPVVRMIDSGSLNPGWFGHPGSSLMYTLTIPIYIYYAYSPSYTQLPEDITLHSLYESDPTQIFLIARILLLIISITTVYLTYLIGKRLFNENIGLMACIILAISPMHIENTRYVRTDITATMLTLLSIMLLIESITRKEKRFLIASCIIGGISISTKYTSGIILFPILVHCLANDMGLLKKRYEKKILIPSLLALIFGFTATAPYVLIDYERSFTDILHENRTKHLGHERLEGISNYVWYLIHPLREGIGGLFFEIFTVLGMIKILKEKKYPELVLLVFPIMYLIGIGSMNLRWARWTIPILPFEALLASLGIHSTYRLMDRRIKQRRRKKILQAIFLSLIILAAYPIIIQDIDNGNILGNKDTRIIARAWIEEYIPTNSKIAYGQCAPKLHVKPNKKFDLIHLRYKDVLSHNLTEYERWDAEYIIIPKGDSNICKSHYDRYYNEKDKYKEKIIQIQEIESKTKLLKRIENNKNPGPIIEIRRFE